ncbi:MAG: hypothetical protein ACQUHE_00125 [Bacteroidia bacterium]
MKFFLVVFAKLPAQGMALYPFIIVKHQALAKNAVLLNHEKIHLKQQLELLILPFYIFYLLHYVINLILYKNHHQAYMNIVFEKEAYLNEKDLNYFKQRRVFAWAKLLSPNN